MFRPGIAIAIAIPLSLIFGISKKVGTLENFLEGLKALPYMFLPSLIMVFGSAILFFGYRRRLNDQRNAVIEDMQMRCEEVLHYWNKFLEGIAEKVKPSNEHKADLGISVGTGREALERDDNSSDDESGSDSLDVMGNADADSRLELGPPAVEIEDDPIVVEADQEENQEENRSDEGTGEENPDINPAPAMGAAYKTPPESPVKKAEDSPQ